MPVRIKDLKFIDMWGESLENQVLAYEQEPVCKGEIVFYGSSKFKRWASQKYGNPNLREVIVGKSGAPCCINRGFGSSSAEHQLYYYHRMVKPLEPRVMVYCCHGNHTTYGYSNDECAELGSRVVAYALNDFPNLRVYLCSALPGRNMSDEDVADRRYFNSLMKNIADSDSRCRYLDIFEHEELWNSDVFVADGVHFTNEGYGLFANVIRTALKEELENY